MSRKGEQILTVVKEDLPTGWSLATINDLVGVDGVFVDGDWVESKDQDPTGAVRLIQLADIGDGEYRNRSNRFLTHEKALELGCTFLMRDDVLIARMPDPLGRACIFPGDPKKSVSVVDVAIVRSRNGEFNHRWLMYFINAPVFRTTVAALQSGSTRKRISRGNLARIALPVPPREQQNRIVAEIEKQFSRLDEAVANLKRIKANLKRYKAAVLKAAVEGKLTEDWRKAHLDVEPASKLLDRILTERRTKWKGKGKYKEPAVPDTDNLPLLGKGWTYATVEQLGIIGEQPVLTGPFGTNLGREDFRDVGIPVLTISCLKDTGIDLAKAGHVSKEKARELNRYGLKEGDLLFSRMAAVGRAGIVMQSSQGALFNYHIMRLRLEPTVLMAKYYLAYVRGSAQVSDYIRKVNHGATRDGINTEQLLNMPVALPPIPEQHR